MNKTQTTKQPETPKPEQLRVGVFDSDQALNMVGTVEPAPM
jgi:hypothetical protein